MLGVDKVYYCRDGCLEQALVEKITCTVLVCANFPLKLILWGIISSFSWSCTSASYNILSVQHSS